MSSRNFRRLHRKRRILASGVASRPRLSVYRSTRAVYAQVIDDEQGKTLVAASSKELKTKKYDMQAATETGKLLAQKAKEKGISAVVFDRGGYRYHGKVKALSDGAREGGLQF